MHAVVMEVRIERPEEASAYVQSQVVPRVKEAPGFVRGIWTHSKAGNTGRAILVFESGEQADAVVRGLQKGIYSTGEPVGPAGITLVSAETCEVDAEA